MIKLSRFEVKKVPSLIPVIFFKTGIPTDTDQEV